MLSLTKRASGRMIVQGFLVSFWLSCSTVTFQDKTLSCRDCQQPFTFTAGEQEFYASKSLVNEPKRCPNCRLIAKLQRDGKDPAHSAEVPCHECETLTRVPFKPSGIRPVYCPPCLHKQKTKDSDQA